MRPITFYIVGALFSMASVGADAATMYAASTLDITKADFKATGFTYSDASAWTPFAAPVTLEVGDTFDLTFTFLGSQTLTLVGASQIWAGSYADVSSDVTGTGTLSLLDASGTAFLTSSVKTDSEGAVHFGQYFDAAEFPGGLPSTLTFSGLHYVGTVDAYLDPTVTSRIYNGPFLSFTADSNSATVAGTVPEPGVWGLMIAGFGLVGTATRRGRMVAA